MVRVVVRVLSENFSLGLSADLFAIADPCCCSAVRLSCRYVLCVSLGTAALAYVDPPSW